MHYCRDQVSLLALVDDNMAAQEAALRDKADVLVATPARLVAHLEAGNVELKDTVRYSRSGTSRRPHLAPLPATQFFFLAPLPHTQRFSLSATGGVSWVRSLGFEASNQKVSGQT